MPGFGNFDVSSFVSILFDGDELISLGDMPPLEWLQPVFSTSLLAQPVWSVTVLESMISEELPRSKRSVTVLPSSLRTGWDEQPLWFEMPKLSFGWLCESWDFGWICWLEFCFWHGWSSTSTPDVCLATSSRMTASLGCQSSPSSRQTRSSGLSATFGPCRPLLTSTWSVSELTIFSGSFFFLGLPIVKKI